MKQALKEMELDPPGPVEIPASKSFRPDLFLGRIRLLGRERAFLYRVTGWGLVLSLAAAFLIPKEYESTVRLMPPDNQSSSAMAMMAALSGKAGAGLGSVGSVGSVAGDLLGLKSSGELFVGVLESRTVQDRLIDRFDLRRVYRKRLWEDTRKKLTANTGITSDRKSGIITVTVTDGDPRRAAAMGEAYLEGLNRVLVEKSTSGAHRERVFLEERLKTVQQDLEVAEKDFSQYASKNMAIDIKEQGKAMVEAGAMLQGQLIAAESEMEGLRQIYSDNNVRVRSMQARIAELRQQMDRVGGKGEGTAEGAAASPDSLYPSIKKLPLLGVTYADMYRRTKVQEAIYEVLTQQYELAKVQEVKELPSVKVLDQANIPEEKSFPPRALLIIGGTLLFLAFGVAWVLGKQRWEQMDSDHPAKIVALGLYGDARGHLEHAAQNGSRLGRVVRQARRFRRAPTPAETEKEPDAVRQENN
jgi:capsule polysaccharide export protein KpsE/RkpR